MVANNIFIQYTQIADGWTKGLRGKVVTQILNAGIYLNLSTKGPLHKVSGATQECQTLVPRHICKCITLN